MCFLRLNTSIIIEVTLFKYNINHYLSLLPHYIKADDIQKRLSEEYEIPSSQFSQDKNIESGSQQSISSWRLECYARVLDVPVERLLTNHEPESAEKSFH
jgi:hypothetical protein